MGKSAKKRPRLPKAHPKPEEEDDDPCFKIVQVTSGNPSSSTTEVEVKIIKTNERTGAQLNGVVKGTQIELQNVEKKEEDGAPKESDVTIETEPLEKSNNIVPQKLLGKDISISKKDRRHANPKNSNFCLNCGDSGHEMFSCKNEYSLDDLKEIQCYVCKCFGHLCCANYAGESSRKVSCYRCGKLGHTGLECVRVHEETGSIWTPSACFMCRKDAHLACKCTGVYKKQKRKMEFPSSKKKKKSRRRKNKTQPTSSQPNLITQNPPVYNHNHNHVWESANTLAMYITNNLLHGANGYQSYDRFNGGNGYQPPNNRLHGGNGYNLGYSNPGFYGNQGNFQHGSADSSNGYQHRFSASGFGNSNNYGNREHGWGYYPNRFG